MVNSFLVFGAVGGRHRVHTLQASAGRFADSPGTGIGTGCSWGVLLLVYVGMILPMRGCIYTVIRSTPVAIGSVKAWMNQGAIQALGKLRVGWGFLFSHLAIAVSDR